MDELRRICASPVSTRAGLPILLLVAATSVAACASPPTTPSGGHVRVLGAWEGPELESFRAVLEPFERRTGIRVEYTGSRDLEGSLARGLAVGDPPDIAGLAGPAHLRALARAGVLHDLSDALDLGTYKRETAPAFVDLGTVDNNLTGVFIRGSVKGMLWFNPAVFTRGRPPTWAELALTAETARAKTTPPWCLGLESGASSGWPATDWIEDFLLRRSGPDVYDRWVAGDLPWSSPEVAAAFNSFGTVIADGNVAGGVSGALTTYFSTAGEALFSDPPGCLFLHGGSYMAALFAAASGGQPPDVDFLPFPDIDPRYAGSIIGGGDLFGLVVDTPAARALLAYLAGTEAQQAWVERGGTLSANSGVVSYPDRVTERAAHLLTGARTFRFDASDSMPPGMTAAFHEAVLQFARDQSRLPGILEHLDLVQASESRS